MTENGRADAPERPEDLPAWRGEIVGHRGAAGLAPENTLAGFEAALAAGADRLELDIRLTADRVAVVFHDARLGRFVPGGDLGGPVFRRSSAELFGLDVGAAFGRPGCFVPSFAAVLDGLGADALWNPEIKGSGAEGLSCLRAAIEVLKPRDMNERCIVSSFHEPVLQAARREAPELPRALLIDARRPVADPVAAATRLGCVALHVHRELVDTALVSACRGAELDLRVFTVNEEPELARFMELGLDGIVTDRPDLLARLAGR